MKTIFFLLLIVLVFSIHPSYAKSISSKVVDNFMSGVKEEMEIFQNITKPAAFFDKSLGVSFTGGSGYIRNRISNYHPIHVKLPSFNIGCDGIDYAFGGMSLISAKEFGETLVNTGKAMATHFLVLSLQSASSQVLDSINKSHMWNLGINAPNINSCEIGQSLAEGLWPRETGAHQYICSHIGAKQGFFKNMIDSRHGCSRQGQDSRVHLNTAKSQGLLVGEYNLAYEAMKMLNIESNFYDLYLNITGTIIRKKQGQTVETYANNKKELIDQFEYQYLPSKIEATMRTLIYGEEGTAFQVEPMEKKQEESSDKGQDFQEGKDDNPLFYAFKRKVAKTPFLLGPIKNNGLEITTVKTLRSPVIGGEKAKIAAILNSILEKIIQERVDNASSLGPAEKELIDQSRFPMDTLLNLMGQWEGKNALERVSTYEIAELLAYEKVTRYAEEVLRLMLSAAASIEAKQVSTGNAKEFQASLYKAIDYINKKSQEVYLKMTQKMEMINFLINIERNLRENPIGNP